MSKKMIRLTEENLYDRTEQAAASNDTQQNVITEMARINTKEDDSCIFPDNAFNVQIWSNDHKPPHFHILSNGWDISFYVSNGELYKMNKEGKDSKTYQYIIENVKAWLTSQCAIIPQITNRQNAVAVWEELHS